MSNLLIDDYPLILQPALARMIGLYPAIFLQYLHFWLERSKHIDETGRKWVYNSVSKWSKLLNGICSDATIRRSISMLENLNLIQADNFNKNRIDRTKWYSINYEVLDKMVKEFKKQELLKAQNDMEIVGASKSDSYGTFGNGFSERANAFAQREQLHLLTENSCICSQREDAFAHREQTNTIYNNKENNIENNNNQDLLSLGVFHSLDEKIKFIKDYAITANDLLVFAQKYGVDVLLEKIRMMKAEEEKHKLKNPGGWLRTALEKDFRSNEEYEKAKQERIKDKREAIKKLFKLPQQNVISEDLIQNPILKQKFLERVKKKKEE